MIHSVVAIVPMIRSVSICYPINDSKRIRLNILDANTFGAFAGDNVMGHGPTQPPPQRGGPSQRGNRGGVSCLNMELYAVNLNFI